MPDVNKYIIEVKLNPPIIRNHILKRTNLVKKIISNDKIKLIMWA